MKTWYFEAFISGRIEPGYVTEAASKAQATLEIINFFGRLVYEGMKNLYEIPTPAELKGRTLKASGNYRKLFAEY